MQFREIVKWRETCSYFVKNNKNNQIDMPLYVLGYILLLLFVTENAEALTEAKFRAATTKVASSTNEAGEEQRLWVRSGKPTPAARSALRFLADARSHGLDDETYEVHRLHALYAGLVQGQVFGAQVFEATLSQSLLRLIRDMRPAQFRGWQRDDRRSTLLAAVRNAVNANELEPFFDSLVPLDPQYAALRKALQIYESRPRSSHKIVVGEGRELSRGDTGPRVARLKIRLLGTNNSACEDDERCTFDEPLERAVRAHQEVSGLASDGIVGRSTVRHLDMSDAERITRIKLNLDRWRRLPVDLGRDHVLVNIPEYRMRYVRARKQSLTMRVVVGSKSNPTPEFSDEIEYLVFNPYWYVPRSIVREELLPTARTNNDYLRKNRYELLADGRPISAEDVDISNVDFSRSPYRVRQTPGSHNALGVVKFLFPNPQNIYLHDSPAKTLYTRSRRAFSHGCIRIEYPDLLARALLEKKSEWTESRIQSTITRGARRQVNLDESVPIYLTYFTVRVLDNGEVAFFDDIYGRDSEPSTLSL